MPAGTVVVTAAITPKEQAHEVQFYSEDASFSIEDISTPADQEAGIVRLNATGQSVGRGGLMAEWTPGGHTYTGVCVTVGTVTLPLAVAKTSTPVIAAGGTAILDGRDSHDTDEVGVLPDLVGYAWTLRNKTNPAQAPIAVFGDHPSLVLTEPGEYGAELIVTDGDCEQSSAHSDAHVTIKVVRVTFNPGSVTVAPGGMAQTTATIVPDSAVDDVTFSVDSPAIATVDKDRLTSTPGTFTVTGVAAGSTTLRAEITTNLGSVTVGTAAVTVRTPTTRPVAVAQTSTPILCAGGAAQLVGSLSHDTDTVGEAPEIREYRWTLANLTTPGPPILPPGAGALQNVTLTEPGDYEALLVVKDNDGEFSVEGAAGARVTFQVIQVTFNKNPIIVGVSKAETVTATVVPAGVVDEVKFRIDDETIANLDQDRIAASPGTLTLTGLARGTTTLRAEILTDLGSETCGSVVVKGGKIDFMRITPDPGILTPSEQTTFTAIGFAQVKDFPFLPHEFSPDLATAVGTEITVGASKGIFLGPVPVSWILSGGAAAEAFIPTGVPTVEVPSVVVEATSTAVGEIVPDLVCHGIGKEDKADLKVLVRVAFAANPIITGFSFPATKSSLGKEIGVLVQPPHAVDQIKFVRAGDQPTRVEVFEIEKNKGTGLIRLRVEGRSATPADMPGGDTEILAMLGEKVLRTAKVIVVVPTIQKHDVSSGYVLQNTAKPAGGGKTNVKSIAGTIVKISIFDQFGKLLDSVYNGQGVVTELFKDFHPPGVAEKSFPAGELAISFPDAKFENGIKLDLSSSTLSANIDGVMTGNEIKQWEQKLFFIAGNNNTFSLLLTQDQTVAATQEIRVHNHLMTPDFRRTIVDKDANFPPVPFEVRDVAK